MASGLVAEYMQAYINRILLSEVTNWSTIATLNSTQDFIMSLVQFLINSVLLLLFFLHIFPWSTASPASCLVLWASDICFRQFELLQFLAYAGKFNLILRE
jgi:hypothetical protein